MRMPDGFAWDFTRGFTCKWSFACLVVVAEGVIVEAIVTGDGAVIRARGRMGVDFDHRHRADHEHHQQRQRRHMATRDAKPDGQAVAEGSERHCARMPSQAT